MATRSQRPKEEEPPADWIPTQAVDEPILNGPFAEPDRHWVYTSAGNPSINPSRRPASYWYKSKEVGEKAQRELWREEEAELLPLVNRLRTDVRRWRESGYRGASQVTKELFAYWTHEERPRRLFFCQQEAVETIIYLLELGIPGRLGSSGFRSFEVGAEDLGKLLRGAKPDWEFKVPDYFPRLIDPSGDPASLALRRLGCKMATGSGKTVVMAMIIAWAFCNRGRNPSTTSYPNGILVCAPNLTVRKRLQVLRPEEPKNYYDEFELVPSKYRELLGAGKVLITNWHGFAPKSPNREGDKSYKVVNKGEETPEAFAKDRLGDLASRLPILVLNDEGHHCWRPKVGTDWDAIAKERSLTSEEKERLKEEAEEARVWLAGLDRINNCGIVGKYQPGIITCVDLSATPFYLANSGYPEGSPFPWLVSDFGLVDAIESGIVKIPRLPVRDDSGAKDDAGKPDPKYFRLWRHIGESLRPVDKLSNGRPKPDAVYREAEGALLTLASQWQKKFLDLQAKTPGEQPIPPVMIVVCDNTEIAELVFTKISGEKVVEVPAENGDGTVEKVVYEGSQKFPLFANTETARHTVRIDSKLLAKIETEEGETRDEAAQALREIIDTVGKRGGPGEQVRCVVSVSMLTEGWDASNVTHILGIRAFGSQLLCEQVVGRGLRRMDYRPDPETGKLSAEYVDVYGIPFSLIPFKGRAKDKDPVDVVYHHVFAVPERKHLEIRMPVVESYTYDVRRSGISCDVDSLEGFVVDDEPTKVYVMETRGYQDQVVSGSTGNAQAHTREEFYSQVRFQHVAFWLAQLITDDLIGGARGKGAEELKKSLLARHQLFPEIVRIVQLYVEKKVKFVNDVDRRELALEKYATLLRERVRDGIVAAAATEDAPLLPIVNSYKPFASTSDANFRTARPVVALSRSHLNFAVLHSGWEKDAVEILEDMDGVEAYSPNDRNVGFTVPYEYLGSPARYEPDFVVRMRGAEPGKGRLVLLEIKGRGGEFRDEDRVLAKNAAAKKWVDAVNNARRFGRWTFEICRDLAGLRATLAKYDEGTADVIPFRRVEDPKPEDRFRTCVPLSTLRAAAGRFSEEQASLEFGEDTEWVTFDTKTRFEPGMFVARVQGQSMEPVIPAGSYCLFRQPRGGTRQGKRLLVRHSGIADPDTGGQYTLKVFKSEKVAGDGEEWRHERIILEPLNPAYEPIVLEPRDEGDVGVIAEFVEVVGT